MISRRQDRGGGPLNPIVRGIAAGVGLASESMKHRKEKKKAAEAAGGQEGSAAAQQSGESDADHDNHSEAETAISKQLDEASWALDDAQDEVAAEQELHSTAAEPEGGTPTEETDTAEKKERHSKKLADGFITRHPVPHPNTIPHQPLSLPVILTQRRPKTRTRGFINAYAPVLEAAGIDQPTFLDLLARLNQALEPSPWIQAINLAGFAGQAIPEPFAILVSLAAKMVADAAGEVHSRGRTNVFLDRLNEGYFKPRGLVALVMTWKPETASRLTEVHMDSGMQRGISAAARGPSGSFSRTTSRLKASSASSSFEWPETAPLVFPALDELADGPDPAQKEAGALKRGGKFVGEYLDRRAQAKWSGQAPDSNMANALPKPEFRSRYADPNHPASSGDIVALLSGGALKMPVRDVRGGAGGGRGGRGGLGGGGRFGGRGAYGARRGRLGGGPVGGLLASRLGAGQDTRSPEEHNEHDEMEVHPRFRGRVGRDRGAGRYPEGSGLAGTGMGAPGLLIHGFKKILQQVSSITLSVNEC